MSFGDNRGCDVFLRERTFVYSSSVSPSDEYPVKPIICSGPRNEGGEITCLESDEIFIRNLRRGTCSLTRFCDSDSATLRASEQQAKVFYAASVELPLSRLL